MFSSLFFGFKLVISFAFILELFEPNEMLFFCEDVVVELLLGSHVVVSEVLNLLLRRVDILFDSPKSSRDIVFEQLFLFLGFTTSVRGVDLFQIFLFFVEKHLGLLDSVIKIRLLPDLLGLHIQVVKILQIQIQMLILCQNLIK